MMMMMTMLKMMLMMIAWPQHSATRPALVRKPLEEPFHLPTIWQPHRGMKHVCVAECSRPMPVIHLEVGQQAVRSRVPPSSASHPEGFQATSGGRRLQNLPPDVFALDRTGSVQKLEPQGTVPSAIEYEQKARCSARHREASKTRPTRTQHWLNGTTL